MFPWQSPRATTRPTRPPIVPPPRLPTLVPRAPTTQRPPSRTPGRRRENNPHWTQMGTQNRSRSGRVRRVRSAGAERCDVILRRGTRAPIAPIWASSAIFQRAKGEGEPFPDETSDGRPVIAVLFFFSHVRSRRHLHAPAANHSILPNPPPTVPSKSCLGAGDDAALPAHAGDSPFAVSCRSPQMRKLGVPLAPDTCVRAPFFTCQCQDHVDLSTRPHRQDRKEPTTC